MTNDIMERRSGMLWCNERVGIPIETRQGEENYFLVEFRTVLLPNLLIAGVEVILEDNGDVVISYHGPAVDGTGSKILGNIFHNWERKPANDE